MTMQGEIRPGYKQTEVGVIPDDWDTRHLSQELDGLEAGVSVNSVDEQLQSAPHNIYILKTSAVSNGSFIASEVKKVAPRDLKRVKTHARADTIILSRMNTPDLVGESGYVEHDHPTYFLPDRLWMTRFKRDSEICVKWLSYLLTSQRYKVIVKSAATGTSGTMKNISKGAFTSILLPWPQPEEQRAIAAALSDADALIAALEAMIAKKRDLKQAAMQNLLTGKTRLPGFSGEWEVKRLGELLGYEQPTKYLVSSTEYDDSYDIPVLTAGKSFLLGHTNESHGVFTQLPVIIFDDFTTATQFVDFPFKAKSSAMKLLKSRNAQVNLRLVYDMMQTIEFVMSDHKRYWISEYQKIEVPFPDPAEQAAIAEVLSDMDAELAALEAQTAKARAIKQGMMQELLTGKVRLI